MERDSPDKTTKMPTDLERLRRLERLVDAPRLSRGWTDDELLDLPRLYRFACSTVARLEATGQNPKLAAQTRVLVTRAHGILHAEGRAGRDNPLLQLVRLYLRDVPRAIRAEWRLVSLSLALMYGLALIAWFGVSADLDLAPSLLDAGAVQQEIQQLQDTADGEPFRGNFTFGLGESPATAGLLMLHNIGIGILFFASALIPPLYVFLLATNALMLGTYTAVAGHWGQAGAISSILWCHGVFEIQAIILAGSAGLVLVRAWVKPGAWTRRYALQRESRRALLLLAPTFPLLFFAGLIEAFVSPHAPIEVRIGVAITTGIALLAWVLLSGRGASRSTALARN